MFNIVVNIIFKLFKQKFANFLMYNSRVYNVRIVCPFVKNYFKISKAHYTMCILLAIDSTLDYAQICKQTCKQTLCMHNLFWFILLFI